jgi:8-oxo-dGTP diphosphatase
LTAPVLAVGAVVLNRSPAPRVLLIRRGTPPRKGGWSLPGGRVERGEPLAAALRREIAEETGLDVTVGPLVEVVELIDEDHHYVVLDYLCDAVGGDLRAGTDAAEAAFVPVTEIGGVGVTDAVRAVVAKALEMALETAPTRP